MSVQKVAEENVEYKYIKVSDIMRVKQKLLYNGALIFSMLRRLKVGFNYSCKGFKYLNCIKKILQTNLKKHVLVIQYGRPFLFIVGITLAYYIILICLVPLVTDILDKIGYGYEIIKLCGFLIISMLPIVVVWWCLCNLKIVSYEPYIKWWTGDFLVGATLFTAFYLSYGYTILGYDRTAFKENELIQILFSAQSDGGIVGIPYVLAVIRLMFGHFALAEKQKSTSKGEGVAD